MKKLYIPISLMLVVILIPSCRQNETAESSAEELPPIVISSVTVTNPVNDNMSEIIELNAVSTFLLKSFIKATTNGYLQSANIHMGQLVHKGELLFSIKTKEAQSLGNLVNQIDSNLHFEGVLHINAPGSGYITQLNYQAGDYVQDGETLATITDNKSFVFLLNVPYELKPFIAANKNIQLLLPDSTVLNGVIEAGMPMVSNIAQTQDYIIRVPIDKLIPENIIAKVTLVKSSRNNIMSLPKSAVLSDETQSQFWIMQLISDSTAVKVPVTKGIEIKDRVEITSPILLVTDRILLTGNYGLPDTASVTIIPIEK